MDKQVEVGEDDQNDYLDEAKGLTRHRLAFFTIDVEAGKRRYFGLQARGQELNQLKLRNVYKKRRMVILKESRATVSQLDCRLVQGRVEKRRAGTFKMATGSGAVRLRLSPVGAGAHATFATDAMLPWKPAMPPVLRPRSNPWT